MTFVHILPGIFYAGSDSRSPLSPMAFTKQFVQLIASGVAVLPARRAKLRAVAGRSLDRQGIRKDQGRPQPRLRRLGISAASRACGAIAFRKLDLRVETVQ